MYPISSDVKALFESEQRQVLRVTGTDRNGKVISITDENVAQGGFNIDRYCCNGEKLEVGTAIVGQMTLKLDNRDGQYNDVVFEGAEMFVEVGIADWTLSNPITTYIPCGYFTPDEQPRALNNISLICMDRMTKFDEVADAASLTFPMTVAGLVEQACTICGVTLGHGISTLTNADVRIASFPTVQGKITYRNLIQWCAGIMATNAWFDWKGELRFTSYDDNATGYEMTTSNRFSSDYYEDDLTVTGVVYTNDSGVEIVEGTDDYAIDLTGNGLVGPLIATVLPTINTALNGFQYRPFSASVINAPYLWPMDMVTYIDKDGNSYSSVLTNVAFGLNGATALESKGMTYAVNAQKQPYGVTKEQAQIISEAMTSVEANIDQSMTQEEIFNRLTDHGAAQGMVLYDGQLYINASYINAGKLSAEYVDLNSYNSGIYVPDEFDAASLFSGQSVSDGWIVQARDRVKVMYIPDAVAYRGKTILLSMTTVKPTNDGSTDWTDENGNYNGIEWRNAASGAVDATGALIGDTSEGDYYKFSRAFTVPDDAVSFTVNIHSSGVRAITANVSLADTLDMRYGSNVGISYKGLQVGKMVVDRTGNATFGGSLLISGDIRVSGSVSFDAPSDVRANLGITPANIGAVPTSGGTMTGALNINNGSGNGVSIFKDGEGGTILIYAPDGHIFEADAVDGSVIRVHNARSRSTFDEPFRFVSWDAATGALSVGSVQPNIPVAVAYGGTGGKTAAAARANLGAAELSVAQIKSGDVIDLTNQIYAGHVTGSGKLLAFNIPLYSNASGLSVSVSGSITTRCGGQYITGSGSSATDLSTFQSVAANVQRNSVQVVVTAASPLTTAYNNYPCTIQFGAGSTLTFR